jgi:hypothetical protein
LEKADAAEARVIEELRRVGHEVLLSWAKGQESRKSAELEKSEQASRRKKKKPLLAHPLRNDRDRGTNLYERWSDSAALFELRRGSLPKLLYAFASRHHGFPLAKSLESCGSIME